MPAGEDVRLEIAFHEMKQVPLIAQRLQFPALSPVSPRAQENPLTQIYEA
jgi:hypothetical protein